MKTTVLSAAIAILSLNSAFSQQENSAMPILGLTSDSNFTIGINGGIPVGDFKEYSTFNLGADVAYRYGLSEQFELGGLVGYSHFFGDSGEEGEFSWEVEDVQFLPLAATARFNTGSFFLGGDIGYAVGINDGNEGGFYYRPLVGYNFGKLGVIASYSGISRDSFIVASVNLGLEIKL